MNRRLNYIMFFIFVNFFQIATFAQIESNYHNKVANATGISRIYPSTIAVNPSQTIIRNMNAGFYISPSKLGISELNYGTAFLTLPLDSNWATAFDITGSGGDLFSEIIPSVSICYFDEKFSIAIKSKYSQISIRDFNNEALFYTDIGATVNIVDNYFAGFSLSNIFGATFKGAEYNSHQTAVIGVGTRLTENLATDINYIMYLNYFSTVSFTMSYQFYDYLSAAISYQGNPAITQLDFLFAFGDFDLPLSVSYFDLFGFALSMGIVYEL